jgi:thiol:disulfide interchange protein
MTFRPWNALMTALAALILAAAVHAPARGQMLYDPHRDAKADIHAALDSARADHKLVLLDFGADWCLDCVILDRLFADAAVAPYLRDHYHVVRIDVGQFDRNLDISRKYGDVIHGGVPAVVVLSPGGGVLANTREGEVESARRFRAADVRRLLEQWAARAP